MTERRWYDKDPILKEVLELQLSCEDAVKFSKQIYPTAPRASGRRSDRTRL